MRLLHLHNSLYARHPAWLAMFALASSATARAEPLDLVTIHWQAPPKCPSESALRAQLHRDLHGSRVSRRLDADIQVVMLSSQQWQSRLRIRDDVGRTERVLSAQHCDALLSVTSLVLATMIDPDLAPEPPDAPRAQQRVPEPTANGSDPSNGSAPDVSTAASVASAPPAANAPGVATAASAQSVPIDALAPSGAGAQVAPVPAANAPEAAATDVPTSGGSPPVTTSAPNQKGSSVESNTSNGRANSAPIESPASVAQRELGLSAALSGGIDSGSLPKTTAALDARIAVDLYRFRVEAAFGWWLPQSATLRPTPDAAVTGRFSMIALGARGCARLLKTASLSLLPCVGLELERWRGQGDQGNIERSQSAALWGAGVTGGALGLLKFSQRLSLRGSGEAVAFIGAPAFGFLAGTIRTEVFQPDKLSLRGQVGLELDFW